MCILELSLLEAGWWPQADGIRIDNYDNNSDYSFAGVSEFRGNWNASGGNGAGATTLAELERQAIATALARHAGNITYAAQELGITRTSLYRRMEKLGIAPGSQDGR